MKAFMFVNEAAKRDFLALPTVVKQQFGADLNAVQQDAQPFSAFKHLTKSVGIGAVELIENGSPAFRAVYCAKFGNTVYVLHAFTKITNGVDQKAMKTARQRYKEMKSLIAEENKT